MSQTLFSTQDIQYAAWRAFLISTTPNPQVSKGAYRPVGWATEGARTYIEDEEENMWIFDAVIKIEHLLSQRITQHPVQTGANITDHSYALPARISLEIGMSDVMDSFIPGQWGSDSSEPTKSVMAYQTMLKWKDTGAPLRLVTRLGEYYPMVIENISSPDTKETKYGLRCFVTFQQIFTSEIVVVKTSARPQTTDQTQSGSRQVTPMTGSVLSGYRFPSWVPEIE